jgi:acyl-[acyl-carrier-protein]-phospholipid O-acyltransferase/long-chain-fatty-acid--[acyl-carrier-protein] ligase
MSNGIPLPIDPPSLPGRRRALGSPGFVGLVVTQFLGAFNDNMFRWLVVPIGQRVLPGENAETMALVLGGVCFTLPYLVLVAAAGSLADKFSKRSVIVGCKVAEVAIMLLGTAAILTLNVWFLFATVMLMGAHSAMYGPSKFGSLPEILRPAALSKGNGVMGLVTVIASALGTVAGFRLFDVVATRGLFDDAGLTAAWPAAIALTGVAIAGLAASLFIPRLSAANPATPFKFDPLRETAPALKGLFSQRRLLRAALGIAFFWFLASLAQLNIDPFADIQFGLDKKDVGILLAVLVAGLGAGSVLAGWWSGGKVELGIVPLGTLGIIVSSLMLYVCGSQVVPSGQALQQSAFWWSCFWLFQLGVGAGLFNIPLETYLQHESDERSRGTVLAGSNFVSFSLILVSCALFFLLRGALQLSPAAIFMVAGLGTIPVAFYVIKLLPDVTLRFIFWLTSHSIYRLRVYGSDNVPEKGGALLVANHVSWVDGVLVLVSTSRLVRFIVYADYANAPLLAWMSRIMGVIPISSTDGPKAIVRALQTAREAVQKGELVCIFAEGQLTRTGQMQTFQPGLMRIVGGSGAPVIPIYLHGLWGSIFSFAGGRYFWKLPKRWPYPVSIHFGKPITEPGDVNHVRRAVEQLGVDAVMTDKPRRLIPARQFVRQSKRSRFRQKVADSGGAELTGGKLLAGSIAMLRLLEREVLARDEQTVGLLLPPSVGGCVANVALALGRRTSVNLNYTMTDEVISHCVREAGLKHVLTSRRFLEKKPIAIQGAELVYLEDLKERITKLDQLRGALCAYVLPAWWVERIFRLTSVGPDELLTIIFTSGSTGEPKGVMLSQRNIGSNVDAGDQVLNLKRDDGLLGILPFFHSFGYTVSMWLPLCYDPQVVFHFNPLDARLIGKLVEKHKLTILMATPTFLRGYLRRVEPEQFKSLDLVVTGAEKLPRDLADQFQERFAIMPTEGYGTTELSPIVSINIPDRRSLYPSQLGEKLGTIGRCVPGVAAKIVDPDTGADLGIDQEGLLWIKGPNVMTGYLNQPEKTAEVMRDGWYNTGDMARIDRDGFITITGRLSRFSKIGGEMVPHIRIEEAITRIVEQAGGSAAEGDGPDLRVAVTAVPDPSKGERIIVLHLPLPVAVDEIRDGLRSAGLPNLWIPGADSFVEIESIPLLGTGKFDLKGMQTLALEKCRETPVEA